MAHFAQIDENNKVTQVIVVDNTDCLDEQGNESEEVGVNLCESLLGGVWKKTSYNGNVRKNYASIGMTYDEGRDAFLTEKLFDSWVLDEETCQYHPPIPYPERSDDYTEKWKWDEDTLSWIRVDEV